MIRRHFCVSAVTLVLVGGSAHAEDNHFLQGLFCNTEAQIDEALKDIAVGASPLRAAALANRDEVVCTYIDRIMYVIVDPVTLGDPALPLIKFRGTLVGVRVGDALRPVNPEIEIFFLTTQQIGEAPIERRT